MYALPGGTMEASPIWEKIIKIQNLIVQFSLKQEKKIFMVEFFYSNSKIKFKELSE